MTAIATAYTIGQGAFTALAALGKLFGIGGAAAAATTTATAGTVATTTAAGTTTAAASGIVSTIAVATLVIGTAYFAAKVAEQAANSYNAAAGNVAGGTTPGGFVDTLPKAAMNLGYSASTAKVIQGSIVGNFLKSIFGDGGSSYVGGPGSLMYDPKSIIPTLTTIKDKTDLAGISMNMNLGEAIGEVNTQIGTSDLNFSTFAKNITEFKPAPIIVEVKYKEVNKPSSVKTLNVTSGMSDPAKNTSSTQPATPAPYTNSNPLYNNNPNQSGGTTSPFLGGY
jgi:hypothetical protein